MQTTRIQNITYNPASRAFEARVAIHEGGEVFTYPCSLRAPIDMDTTLAARRLVELARRRHVRASHPTRARRPENIIAAHVPTDVSTATDALWQRMLGHAA
ncbi:hypothetical protein OB2597_13243 [Pseudooceanicola batsensis HTCC2597]|uniref:Orotidine 5-phosphate decarboxylase n=1 Tax=Pseudooceanicola batsensis (strain ATCC BAA-863 / DSM 15984 / KCTC 12145 / HTCC2597) TaxID=252305 RepID=A3TY77_PSEBH|nr:hypothetical protein [Pseudooceanicola batsensis]EAQ03111.1 hypothetical protein OB2597_13243 [Pseudooceanicola batsensis HTCC2597]